MTKRLIVALQVIALTFWVGALWTSGFLVAPTLFSVIDERTLAGTVAGRVFEMTAFTGIACGSLVLLTMVYLHRTEVLRRAAFWIVVIMLGMVMVGQFGLQPVMAALREQAYPLDVMRSAEGERFALWHAAAQSLYLVQCLLGIALVVLTGAQRVRGSRD